MAPLCQQMSLRLSAHHKELIRSKLEELRQNSDDPNKITEAHAVRALIEDAGHSALSNMEMASE